MSEAHRRSRGKAIPLILFCSVCEADTPHFKKGARCKHCHWRGTEQGRARLAHIEVEGKTIECAFEGCTTRLRITPSQKQKFCALTHRVCCIVCEEEFESSSKARKNTCSLPCQQIYTEGILVDRYGVTNVYKSEEIKAKIRATNRERYGDEIASRTNQVKENARSTNLRVYGTPFHTQHPDVIGKIRDTHMERYGGLGVASNEIRKKISNTNLSRYGAANPFAASDFRAKLEATMIRKYGTAYPIPRLGGRSKSEAQLTEFVKSIYSGEVKKDRELLRGRELDIYLPELKLAIEFNGNYWHSDSEQMRNIRGLLPSELHQLKQKGCDELGVKLIFVWENDWRARRALTEQRVEKLIQEAEKVWKDKQDAKKK